VAPRLVRRLDHPALNCARFDNLALTPGPAVLAQSLGIRALPMAQPPAALIPLALAAALLAAPAGAAPLLAQARPGAAVVRIGGSSTVFPIIEQAISAYQKGGRNSQVRIVLQETGTSAGFRRFCRGELALANASRPINSKELKACAAQGIRFVELPIAFDALSVVVNPANTWARMISIKELAALWGRQAQGKVNTWNQVNAAWPRRPIRLCGPGSDSGTYDYFNKAVNGDSQNSRSDYFASENDDALVRCVAKDANALGYFGYSYYATNRKVLRALPVLGTKGMVMPGRESVQKEQYVPLSRPLFLYVNDQIIRNDAEARRFLTFTLQNGLDLAQKAGFIPLPASTYRLVESKLYRHVLGTAFGGDLKPGTSLGITLQRSLEQTKKPEFR
jgi:phosphate transport system substrate-binding protein